MEVATYRYYDAGGVPIADFKALEMTTTRKGVVTLLDEGANEVAIINLQAGGFIRREE